MSIHKYNPTHDIVEFLIKSDIDLANTLDYHVELVIGSGTIATTNVFRPHYDGDNKYYICCFFANDVVIPRSRLQFHTINIKRRRVGYRTVLDFYYMTTDKQQDIPYVENYLETPVVFRVTSLNNEHIINGELMEQRGYPNYHNVLAFASGMCTLKFINNSDA